MKPYLSLARLVAASLLILGLPSCNFPLFSAKKEIFVGGCYEKMRSSSIFNSAVADAVYRIERDPISLRLGYFEEGDGKPQQTRTFTGRLYLGGSDFWVRRPSYSKNAKEPEGKPYWRGTFEPSSGTLESHGLDPVTLKSADGVELRLTKRPEANLSIFSTATPKGFHTYDGELKFKTKANSESTVFVKCTFER